MPDTPKTVDFLPRHGLLAIRSLRWCMELGPDLPTAEELAEAGLPVDLVPAVLRHVRARWNMHAKPIPGATGWGGRHNRLTPGDAALWLRDLAADLESDGHIDVQELHALREGLSRIPHSQSTSYQPPTVRVGPPEEAA